MQPPSPFRLMILLFSGMGASAAYGLLSLALIFLLDGKSDGQAFFFAFTSSFKTLISLGLIVGIALMVFLSQEVIPSTIEAAFTHEQLSKTDYYENRRRFRSPRRSIEFSAEFTVVAFIIFLFCRFPLSRLGEGSMIIAGCAQYALGVYVGRKLCYAGMMLHSLLKAPVTRNLFRKRELDVINTCVNVASTLTIIFAYIHLMGYYEGPFLYDSILGQGVKPFLLVPGIIATPVLLIFNFYPRAVLRKVYDQSINLEIKKLKNSLRKANLTAYEKHSYLIEVDRMSREELRYSLQLTLSDLPIGITILIMILEPLLKR